MESNEQARMYDRDQLYQPDGDQLGERDTSASKVVHVDAFVLHKLKRFAIIFAFKFVRLHWATVCHLHQLHCNTHPPFSLFRFGIRIKLILTTIRFMGFGIFDAFRVWCVCERVRARVAEIK